MSLIMNEAEVKQIDSKVEQMMDWAKARQAEAEQLALDSARLISCTSERMERLSNQGFFKRCWSRFTGEAGGMERANASDLSQMQKMAFSYINMLQEQELLMAHSMLALKNNLLSLSIKEEETRNLVGILAQRTLDRFEKLESRVEQLEISTNLQGWLLGLEERDYDKKFPTEYMRFFQIINDFYSIKNDNWNYNDYIFMRKSIRIIGLNPKQKISLNEFIDHLIDEIQLEEVGFNRYREAITLTAPTNIENYSKYSIDNISSPVFAAMHELNIQYMDCRDMIEEIQDELNCNFSDALKKILKKCISNLNVNINYALPLAETAMEIIGSMRLVNLLKNYDNHICSNINQEQMEISQYVQDENTECDSATSLEEFNTINLDIREVSECPFDIHGIKFLCMNTEKCLFYSLKTNEYYVYSILDNSWSIIEIPKIFRFSNNIIEIYIYMDNLKIKYINNIFVLWNKIHYKKIIFYSYNCIDWNIIDLSNDYKFDSIEDIVFCNDKYIIYTQTKSHYSYIEKGLVWDSSKTDSTYGSTFFEADSLDSKWRICENINLPKGYYIERDIFSNTNMMMYEVLGDSEYCRRKPCSKCTNYTVISNNNKIFWSSLKYNRNSVLKYNCMYTDDLFFGKYGILYCKDNINSYLYIDKLDELSNIQYEGSGKISFQEKINLMYNDNIQKGYFVNMLKLNINYNGNNEFNFDNIDIHWGENEFVFIADSRFMIVKVTKTYDINKDGINENNNVSEVVYKKLEIM